MKRSIFLMASLLYCSSAYAVELPKPISPARLSQALKSGKRVKVAFLNKNSDGKTGGCIGVDHARKDSDVPLKRFRCDLPLNNTPNNQYWIITPTKIPGEDGADGRYVTIRNWKSDKCMGVDNGSPLPHAEIRQFDCRNHPNQKWKFSFIKRGNRGAVSIQNYDNLCVSLGRGNKDGGQLTQEKCSASRDQDWRTIPFRY